MNLLDKKTVNHLIKEVEGGLKNIRAQDSDVAIWYDWYKGYVPTFHRYYVWNSIQKVYKDKLSMQGARLVSKEWATLLSNEKIKIGLPSKEDTKRLNSILDKLKFRSKLSAATEQGFALSNASIAIDFEEISAYDEENEENSSGNENGQILEIASCRPVLTVFNAWSTTPLEIEGGEFVEAAFVKEKKKNKRYIFHVRNENGNYDILIVDDNKGEEKRKIYKILLDCPYKTFAVIHPNEVNNQIRDGAGYTSIFANAIDILKSLDTAYDSLNNEIILGKKRIWVKSSLTKYDPATAKEEPLFDPNDTVYNVLPSEVNRNGDKEDLIKDTTTDLRVDELVQAISYQLNLLGKSVGLGGKYFKTDNTGMVTATQVISENSDTYNNIKKHEIVIGDAIKEICKAIMSVFNTFLEYNFNLEQDVLVKFDDSIIQDKDSEKVSDLNDVKNGIMSKVEFRMKWYNESENTAKKNIGKYFGDEDLANRINKFKDAYTLGLINPELFVDLVYTSQSEEEKAVIVEYLKSNKPTANDFSDLSGMGIDTGENNNNSLFDNNDNSLDNDNNGE